MKPQIKRGEVYYARIENSFEVSEEPTFHPVVIVSRDIVNQLSQVVLAVPITPYNEGQYLYLSHVLLPPQEAGLEQQFVAMAELVRPIAKERLVRLRGTLSRPTLEEIERALRIALDLP